MALQPVYSYIDYRTYLSDFYAHEKKAKSYFSLRFFAQRAGLKSPILLKMVIDGKRNLSRKSIEQFIKGIGLKEQEAVYFRNLVLFNQAKTSLEKQEHYRVLHDMIRQVPRFIVEQDHFEFYDKWYYSVIREGICHFRYKDNYDLIARSVNPRISPREARQAVRWLLENGFIIRRRNGTYYQTNSALATRSEVRSLVVRNFNRRMIQLGERSLDEYPVDKRYATGLTVGLTAEAYALVVAECEAFRDRLIKITDAVKVPDRVYQLNLQAFPLMERPKE